MKKIKLTLSLALFVATTAVTTLAQAPGQIPIVGRPISEPDKTTATAVLAANEPKNEVPSEISNYLWTLANVIKQIKF